MNVDEIMTTKVITCTPDTPVSEALGLMERYKIHQIPVLAGGDKLREKGDVLGIITLNKIIISEVNAAKAKVKAFLQNCPRLAPDDNLKKAAKILLDSNMRALPVWDGKLVGIVSEQDVMQNIRMDGTAADYAKKCLSVDPKDPVAKVKRIMVYNNVSRIAVARGGKLEGVVGTLDLVPLMRTAQKAPIHGAAPTVASKERIGTNQAPARNFIHGVQMVDFNSSATAAVKILRGSEEVFLQQDGNFYIITPKDVLKSYAQEQEAQLVEIAGIGHEDNPYVVARMYESAQQLVETLSKSLTVQSMKIYVKQHHKQGTKIKYSVKIELPTSLGMVVATKSHEDLTKGKSYGDLLTIFQHSLDDIERQVRKLVGKDRKPERRWASRRRAKEGY